MKQTPKIKLILYFCLGLFVLNACTLEEDVVREQAHQEKMKLESKSFHELLQTSLFSTAYKKVINKKVTLSNDFAARTALEDQYGFTIVEDQPVKVITDVDGITYYTIAIERDVKEELKFENLVIKVDSTDVGATILKYELDTKAVYNYEHDSYDIDIKETSAEELEVDGVLIQRQYINIWYWYSHCTVSPDHPNYCGGNPQSVHWTPACSHSEVVTIVIDNGLGGNSGGGGGGGTPTGGEGGGAVSGNGGSTVTPPNPDGITPIGESTPPIKTVVIPSEEVVEVNTLNPCDLLKKLQADTNFKNRLSGLIYNARNWSFEKLWVVNNNSVPTPTNNYSYVGFQGSIAKPTADYNADTNMQGIIHSHYPGLLSIFSAGDLQDLYLKLKNYPVITNNFFIGVVTGNSAYILQVPNRDSFIAFGDKYLSSEDKLDDFMKEIMGRKFGISKNKSKQENEENFLKMIKNLNAGLQLSSADFNLTTPASPEIFNTLVKKVYNNKTNQIEPSQCN